MISKIKKPVSILLVFMMIVSLFAAVPMTVNAAPPGATYTATFTFSPSLVGRYVETPGRGASNTMVFPDCDVYITGVTRTQTIHNTSVTYSHSIEGSYDVLYFNGQVIYRGDWAVPDGIRIVSGSGTSSDPYVTEWYSTPTITWKLDEDTVIDTTKVPFDAVPTHAAPTKEPDEEYTYTFAGWSPEPVAVTDDATYTATFTAVPRPYNVNVETAEHGTVTANPAEAAKGNQVTLTAEPDAGYALSSIKAFKKNTNSQQATLTALDGSSTGGEGYDKLVDGNTNTKWGFNGGSGYIIVKADKAFRLNDYSLTTANDTNNYSGRNWKNWGIYGANFASDSEAVKNSDQWQLVTSVTNDSKLQATNFTRYDYSVNTDPEAYQYYKIEISANKGDGYTQMSELTLSGANYDVEVVLMQDSADPAKYTFEMPASNVTVKAEFEAIPTYTVTWKNGDTTLKPDTVDKDSIPAYDGETPTKASDSDKHYTFSGWSDGTTTYGLNDTLPAVSGDVTYTAQFTEAAHTFNTNPVFNWTQTNAPTGDWDCNKLTLSCECGATQDTDVYGISFSGGGKSSAVKCTANADGSYTYSVSKKVGSTTYQDSKTVDANGVVYTANQLKAAAKLGGEWELGNDIAEVTGVSCADGFVLDGNNKTLSAHTSVKTSPMFKSANKTAEYTLKNLTIDGVAGETQLQPAISSATTSTGQTNVINLEGVTITNYDFDAANNGAVLAFGQAEVNLTNCNIDTDSQYDVWGGAASTINVSGGEVGALYLNGGTSTADLTNGAVVDAITAANGATIATDNPSAITTGADYKVKDNGDGTYSIVPKEYVAQVNDGQKYESLAEAITAAADGDTITVLADTTVPCYFTQIDGKDITIDATGYTVTGTGYTTFPMFNVKATGGLTLAGGTFSNPGGIISNSGTAVVDGATLNAGGFAIQNKGDLEIKSGTITATEAAVTNGSTTANTTITGGDITGKLKMSNDGDGTIKVSGGTFDREVPDEFCAPGFVPSERDSVTGKYSVVIDTSNPLNPLMATAAQAMADGNPFGINSDYLTGTLLGVQRKDAILDKVEDSDETSESGQETGNDMRFVAVLDKDIINSLEDADDYGFVVARLNSSKDYSNTNIDALKANWGNGEKTISAKGTSNNLYEGTAGYEYITCAVNGVEASAKVIARFYYVKGGETYYAKYAGQGYNYTGCIAGMSDLA